MCPHYCLFYILINYKLQFLGLISPRNKKKERKKNVYLFIYLFLGRGKEWGPNSKTCNGEKRPISGSIYPGDSPPETTVVNDVLTKMSTSSPVTLLDITVLSQLRKDGHPSVYGLDGKKGNDCSHWCLAGVPDTWNELLYAKLVL